MPGSVLAECEPAVERMGIIRSSYPQVTQFSYMRRSDALERGFLAPKGLTFVSFALQEIVNFLLKRDAYLVKSFIGL